MKIKLLLIFLLTLSIGSFTALPYASASTITEGATLEHDTSFGQFSSLVQVDSDTYALAYAGPGFDGYISTFTISSSGAITAVKT